MNNTYHLYGMPCSLYTGKVRSYLRKQNISFIEHAVGEAHFSHDIVPAIGRIIMPVLERPDGALLQDTTDIIDFFENYNINELPKPSIPATPSDPVLHTLASLFNLFGSEGMLRPAMHYRWNFDGFNLAFIRNEFIAGLASDPDSNAASELFEFASARMRKAASSLGITTQSIPLIEQSYTEFLHLFSGHLKKTPYILGGNPTIADYGFMAPLYAHLSRDPYPSMQMRKTAPEVLRWVERMNAPEQSTVGYGKINQDLLSKHSIPQSLKCLMQYISQEFLAEITAHVEFANQWIDSHPDLTTGSSGLKNPANRTIGSAHFNWRGIELTTTVMPYRFYLLQRLQQSFSHADKEDHDILCSLFSETGLSALLQLKTHRPVERKNYCEVWGADCR